MEKQLFVENTTNFVKGLYGSEIDIHRACAYCPRHQCYLTVKMLRQHDCLNRQCHHLIKNENHHWWIQRANTKAKRQARKERLNLAFSKSN